MGTPLASFGGALAVMSVVYGAAHRHGRLDSNMLLLSGVMVGAFINAAILVLVALLHQELRTAFVWLMGNLGNATLASAAWLAPSLLALSGVLLYLARGYNLVATGEESALQLGLDVARVKKISSLLASLITGLVVWVSGVVGFVGLIVPHVCRLLLGPDHRLLLPASFLAGASFLIGADLLARTLANKRIEADLHKRASPTHSLGRSCGTLTEIVNLHSAWIWSECNYGLSHTSVVGVPRTPQEPGVSLPL